VEHIMTRLLLAGTSLLLLLAPAGGQPQEADATQPPATQPTSQPAEPRSTLRKPSQARILENLLNRADRPLPIKAQTRLEPAESSSDPGVQRFPLLLEGTFLPERPGRLVREEGRARFVFIADGSAAATRSMPILESQLLETMEREAEAGFSEFIISAEVTRYRGQNYLLLRKVLRRTEHGNLGP
jgi:hypothetical protein